MYILDPHHVATLFKSSKLIEINHNKCKNKPQSGVILTRFSIHKDGAWMVSCVSSGVLSVVTMTRDARKLRSPYHQLADDNNKQA